MVRASLHWLAGQLVRSAPLWVPCASSAPVVGNRRLSGAQRARHPIRLPRKGSGCRRQLALRQRQRHVVRVPLAVHQHLPANDGVRELSDALGLPRLSAPRRSPATSTTTWTTSASGTGSASTPRSRRWRPSPADAGRCRSTTGPERPTTRLVATATTGTRSTRSLPSPARTARGRAPQLVPRARRALPADQRAGAGDRQLRDRHRRRDVPLLGHDLPGHAAGRLRNPQVPPRRATDELASGAMSRLPWATRAMLGWSSGRRRARWRTTACPRRTTSWARPTRRSPRTCFPASGTAASRSSPTSSGSTAWVLFVDGTSADIDTIVWCTGYKITFPFLALDVIETTGNQVALYRRVVHPQRPGLYFIGLHNRWARSCRSPSCSPNGWPTCSRGRPPYWTRRRWDEIEREQRAMRKRYVASTRHTIQVDFHPYMRLLRRERKRTEGVTRAPPRRSRDARRRLITDGATKEERTCRRPPVSRRRRGGRQRPAHRSHRGQAEPGHRRGVASVPAVSVADVEQLSSPARAAQPAWEALGFEGWPASSSGPRSGRSTTPSGSPAPSSPRPARPTTRAAGRGGLRRRRVRFWARTRRSSSRTRSPPRHPRCWGASS